MHDFEHDLKRAASAYIEKTYAPKESEDTSSLEDRVGALLSREAPEGRSEVSRRSDSGGGTGRRCLI